MDDWTDAQMDIRTHFIRSSLRDREDMTKKEILIRSGQVWEHAPEQRVAAPFLVRVE